MMSVRSSRTSRPFTAVALGVLIGLVLLPACSGDDTSGGASSPSVASSSSAPSVAPNAVGFDETNRTEDGLVVQITEIAERKLGPLPNTDDPSAKEGDPFVVLETKTTNRTKAALELVPGAVVKYGPEQTAAAQVLVSELDGAYDLKPNEAYDYAFGFIIPKEFYDQVVMELTVTIEPLHSVVFSGSITPT